MIIMEGEQISAEKPWNVFLPHQIVKEKSSLLCGNICHKTHTICVYGRILGDKITKSADIIGVWQTEKDYKTRSASSLKHQYNFWLTVESDFSGDIVNASLEIKVLSGSSETPPVVCILYNPNDVLGSYILGSSTLYDTRHLQDLKHPFQFDEISQSTGGRKTENSRIGGQAKIAGLNSNHGYSYENYTSQHVLSTLAKDIHHQLSVHDPKSCVKSFYEPRASKFHCVFKMLNLVLALPLLVAQLSGMTGHLLEAGVKYSSTLWAALPKLLHMPSIIHKLQAQGRRWKITNSLNKENNFTSFLSLNCCAQQLVDTLLGTSIIFLITHYGLSDQISKYILDWADGVAQELTSLVQWLMGAPAGLKLNEQLTNFLGHFFIYHIYLWTGYLTLLRSAMPTVIWLCSLTGILGITTQLCLVQDILSMLTLHIYCFYVYAAKIFYLQVYALGSLWRLFRGKKWNVLRSRVDSASYNTDQLFVGTLLFTILLFLLPTTALYYAVFTMIRLLVLTVQGLLSKVVAFLTSLPVFTICVRFVAPRLVAGSAVFRISKVPKNQDGLVLSMQTSQIPFSQLVKLTAPVMSCDKPALYTWGQFLSHVMTGKLIYPWVEARSNVQHKKKD